VEVKSRPFDVEFETLETPTADADEDHLVLSVKKHEGEPPNLDLGMLTSRL
jgi:hypothetical protein